MPAGPPSLLHAFIDESGQRSFSVTSSDYFLMSAVIVKDDDLPNAAAFLAELRRQLGRRPGDPLTFKNLRSHEERLHAAQQIGGAAFLTVSTVVICKRRFDPDRHGWGTDEDTYTKTLELLLERLSWFVRDEGNIFEGAAPDWRLRRGVMTYTVAFIVRYRLASLRALEQRLKERPRERIAWDHLDPRGGRIEQATRVELLQLADLAVSSTAKAFEPDRFGNTEQRYLETLVPRHRRGRAPLSSYGLKIYPSCGELSAWVDGL